MPPTMPKHPNAQLGRHLGRKPATDAMRKKVLPLRNFVKFAGRPIPDTDDYGTKARNALRVMGGNDQEGDCVAVDLAKRVGMINANRPGGSVLVPTTAECLKFYHDVGGPGDNGLYMPDAFDWWRDKGIKIGSAIHKIEGYASFDVTNRALFDAACHWFQGVDLGVALTREQYMHADDSDTWDADGSDVIGGHAVPLTVRGPQTCKIATWAREPSITRNLLHSRGWADEAYVVISRESISNGGNDTNNVNWEALTAAMEAVKSGGTPDIPDDPNPPVPPVPGDWSWHWEHTWNLFFTDVSAMAGIKIGKQPTKGTALDWSAMLKAVFGLIQCAWSKDYAGAVSYVLEILALLGLRLAPDRTARLKAVLAGGGLDKVRFPDSLTTGAAIKKGVDSHAVVG